MTRRRRLSAVAPAKVNLGLEVVGWREDGYHEVVTILQAISLFDRFEWIETGEPFEYSGPAGVAEADDLVRRALEQAPDREAWTGRLRVVKQVPVAAGLGGGSSDAALALRLAWPDEPDAALAERGAALGSDVPFFARGGTALATGTGTTLAALPTPRLWFVLLSPPLALTDKTRRLYRGLTGSDLSDGANVRDITRRIEAGDFRPAELPNAFERQLLEYPVVRYAYEMLRKAGARTAAVSGAGPTVYAVTGGHAEAAGIAARLAEATPPVGAIHVVRTLGPRVGARQARTLAAAIRGRSPAR